MSSHGLSPEQAREMSNEIDEYMRQRYRELPTGYGIDADGNPVELSAEYLDSGLM